MGFILHFYIIYGTNLLTRGPAQITVFCLFQCFAEKEYQTESKRNETFAMIFLGPKANQETWSGCMELREAATRQEGAPRGQARPHPCGPLIAPPTYFFRLYILLYPRNIRESHETAFPPLQPSVPMRSHLRAFSDDLPEGESITEGFYINTIASPMKREQFTTDLRVHSYQLGGFFSLFDLQYKVLLDVLGDLSDVILFCSVFAEIR